MMTYLTPAEVDAIQHLHRRTPYVIQGVSQGIFSVARHYGGMTYQGDRYVYVPITDECIRSDVQQFVQRTRREAKRAAKSQAAAAQMTMGGDGG